MMLVVILGAGRVGAGAMPALVYTNVDEASGLKPHLADAMNHAVAWGDWDGDGRLDLFLGNFCDKAGPDRRPLPTPPNRLFRQVDGGRFVHVPQPAVETRGRTSGAVLVDLDNDGDLDLYVNNNMHVRPSQVAAKNEPSALYRNDGGRFVNVSAESGACPADGAFGRDVGVLDYDGDGRLDLLVLEDRVFRSAGHSRLYRNRGGMRFEDVTARAGLPDDLDGFGLAVADVNGDGRPDVFVCGVTVRLFLSWPDGTFREADGLRPMFDLHSRNPEEYVSGAAFGDIDNDGDMDLIVGTHYIGSRIQAYLNEGLKDGMPQFRNLTKELGLPVIPNKAPTCAIEDFDNDGLPDLYWSAWFAEGAAREPFLCRGLGVRDGLPRFAVPGVEGVDTGAVRRNGAPAGGRGMIYYVNGPPVDWDGDGDLDFFGGAWGNEGSHLWRCDSPRGGNWLAVRVAGTRMNRMGLGAKVRAMAGATLLGYREISMNAGYSGSGPAVARFGLGAREAADVEVFLPGRPEPLKFSAVGANQTLVVTEP
jgi:hypothetical protein